MWRVHHARATQQSYKLIHTSSYIYTLYAEIKDRESEARVNIVFQTKDHFEGMNKAAQGKLFQNTLALCIFALSDLPFPINDT